MQTSLIKKKFTRQFRQVTVLFPWRQVSQLGLACTQVMQELSLRKRLRSHIPQVRLSVSAMVPEYETVQLEHPGTTSEQSEQLTL